MLYDPNRDVIYTTKALYEWLRQQPPRQRYNYTSPQSCVITQYFRAHGRDGISTQEEIIALGWFSIACHHSTFGGASRAAKRAAGLCWWQKLLSRWR